MKNNYLIILFSWLCFMCCCFMLIAIFSLKIQSQKRVDKIWDKYEKDMIELHKNYGN
jgi:hypothetical protein